MDLTVNILEENKLENPFLAEVKKGFDFWAWPYGIHIGGACAAT